MNKKGFTLIELLVVISIISVLSTIGTISFSNAVIKARDAKRLADITQIRSVIEVEWAYSTTSQYPMSWPDKVVSGIKPGGDTAYCYYTDASRIYYLLLVVGIEQIEIAALGSPAGNAGMAELRGSMISGTEVVCPTVDDSDGIPLDTAIAVTEACAANETNRFYCLVGGANL